MEKANKKRCILWVYDDVFELLKNFKSAKEKELSLTKLTWNDTINMLLLQGAKNEKEKCAT